MQEYLEFREKHNDIYRLKISLKNHESQEFEYKKIKEKIDEFLKKHSHHTSNPTKATPLSLKENSRSKINPSRQSQSKARSQNNS